MRRWRVGSQKRSRSSMQTFAELRRTAGTHLPLCSFAEGSRTAAGGAARSASLRHRGLSGRILGRGARRHRGAAAQHTADGRSNTPTFSSDSRASAIVVAAPLAKTLVPVLDRLPRLRTIILVNAGARGASGICRARNVHDFADLSATGAPRCLRRRRCPTKSRSGCTHPVRPANQRASSTSTRRQWRRHG